jgi:Pyruvate dehydrogenase complex, dehydrogenase (E1) component
MRERRAALGGYLPKRVVRARPLALPPDSVYDELRAALASSRWPTTMAFVRLLKDLMKDPEIGARFAPIIPDEARTFGMDSLFPTAKIYDPQGQTYEAVDRNLLLSYKESTEVRSCTRASARPARWRPPRRPARRTPRTART